MSTYFDTRSGKWFNSKAELLAFQRGEVPASPRSVSKPKTEKSEPPKPEKKKPEPEPEQEITIEESDPAIQKVVQETDDAIFDKDFEDMVKQAMLKSLDEIKDELKDRFGVDGRTLRWASEESLNQMYLDRMKATWKAKHNQE